MLKRHRLDWQEAARSPCATRRLTTIWRSPLRLKLAATLLMFLTLNSGASALSEPQVLPTRPSTVASRVVHTPPAYPIGYRHGDCTWIPAVALRAGWPKASHGRLLQIIERESGCCPNVRGGDRVNKDCEVVRVGVWNHRSDSGLLQINGVHWKRDHAQYHGLVCKRMGVCRQEPLLDPLTNLRAGRLLYDVAGWSPWGVPSK